MITTNIIELFINNMEVLKTMDYKERDKKIKNLLYFVSCITNLIHGEIEEIMRGRGRTNEELRDSISYIMEERF